jgi:hypothetical protein
MVAGGNGCQSPAGVSSPGFSKSFVQVLLGAALAATTPDVSAKTQAATNVSDTIRFISILPFDDASSKR